MNIEVRISNAPHGLFISSTDSNDCSTKQEAVKQAEVLGVIVGTMKRWLTKYTLSNDIQRVEQGKYRKKRA
jgi:hypothetical protein